jgi:hypothetical protein
MSRFSKRDFLRDESSYLSKACPQCRNGQYRGRGLRHYKPLFEKNFLPIIPQYLL